MGTRRVEHEIPAGRDREFHEVFLLLDSTPPAELRLQAEEVASVLRVDLDDVEALYEAKSAPAREYAAGRRSAAARISLADFVPHDDEHLRRVALAARRMLAGEGQA